MTSPETSTIPQTPLAPSPGHVLVRLLKHVEKTTTGIYMPEEGNSENSSLFYVESVGTDTDNFTVKPGQVVLLLQGAGQYIQIGEFKGWLVEADEIIGTLTDDSDAFLSKLFLSKP